jgi:acetoin utilization deacetylase AcuC-like enzyme
MKIYYSDTFVLPLPPGHRFPMAKYALLRRRVEEEGLGGTDPLRVPGAATDDELATVHDRAYLDRVRTGRLSPAQVRRMGFPWSPELVERSRRSVGGTMEAGRAALDDGMGVNLSGGTHHAFPDRGEGFCVFNDVAVAARVVQREGRARRVVILDLDVHQGNGTAAVFRADPSVFTFSLHGADNYPFRKEAGDLDVELPDGAGDEIFLEAAERGVRKALAASRPDLAIYLAGADPYRGDRLGRLGVSMEGLEARDGLVFQACREAGLPVAVVMAGGYAPRVEDTVLIHLTTVRTAALFADGGQKRTLGHRPGLGWDGEKERNEQELP